MGWQAGIDKSKKSSVTNETDNSNVAASDNSTAVGAGATVNITDGGAFDTVSETVKRAFGFGSDALGVVGDAFAKAATITTSSQEKQAQAARDSLQAVVALSTEQQKAGVQSLTENVMKWGVIALGLMAGAFVLSQRKGSAR